MGKVIEFLKLDDVESSENIAPVYVFTSPSSDQMGERGISPRAEIGRSPGNLNLSKYKHHENASIYRTEDNEIFFTHSTSPDIASWQYAPRCS